MLSLSFHLAIKQFRLWNKSNWVSFPYFTNKTIDKNRIHDRGSLKEPDFFHSTHNKFTLRIVKWRKPITISVTLGNIPTGLVTYFFIFFVILPPSYGPLNISKFPFHLVPLISLLQPHSISIRFLIITVTLGSLLWVTMWIWMSGTFTPFFFVMDSCTLFSSTTLLSYSKQLSQNIFSFLPKFLSWIDVFFAFSSKLLLPFFSLFFFFTAPLQEGERERNG